MTGDSISNFIISLKNAGMAGKKSVSISYSKIKYAIAVTLSKKGYVGAVAKRRKKEKKFIDIDLLYKNKKARINNVERISKLSKRVYFSVKEIRPVKRGFGSLIISTPKGVLSDDECRKKNVGGEALFRIW